MKFVRGLTSRAESNRDVGSLNLHDWCFRLARQIPSLAEKSASPGVEGEETDGRGHPNTQVPRFLWCLASRYDHSRWPWHTERLEGLLKAQAH